MELLPAYLDRIRECFPNLTISNVRSNSDGLVNDVVIVNDELVFRFPKSDPARQALAHEASLLELVHTHVTLPTPHFEHREYERRRYGIRSPRIRGYDDRAHTPDRHAV